MPPAPGHLAANPLPTGITGALSLTGYQLLAEVAGVGAGRLGPQAFLLVAPDPDPAAPQLGTQIALHQSRLRDEQEAAAFVRLAAQIGYLRLSGYRLALERQGLRSAIGLLNPATGAVAARVPARHPGKLSLSGGASAPKLLAALQALPPAGPPPDPQNPELLREVIMALALQEPSIGGAQAVEVTDRALALVQENPTLDPRAALTAASQTTLEA
jgi:hypothetical protein